MNQAFLCLVRLIMLFLFGVELIFGSIDFFLITLFPPILVASASNFFSELGLPLGNFFC